jgi:hypothetical protein
VGDKLPIEVFMYIEFDQQWQAFGRGVKVEMDEPTANFLLSKRFAHKVERVNRTPVENIKFEDLECLVSGKTKSPIASKADKMLRPKDVATK